MQLSHLLLDSCTMYIITNIPHDNRLELEEERDMLKVKCLRSQSSIAELRTQLQHEKNGISSNECGVCVCVHVCVCMCACACVCVCVCACVQGIVHKHGLVYTCHYFFL